VKVGLGFRKDKLSCFPPLSSQGVRGLFGKLYKSVIFFENKTHLGYNKLVTIFIFFTDFFLLSDYKIFRENPGACSGERKHKIVSFILKIDLRKRSIYTDKRLRLKERDLTVRR